MVRTSLASPTLGRSQISVDYYSNWFDVGTEEISKHDYDGFYALQALCAGLTCLHVGKDCEDVVIVREAEKEDAEGEAKEARRPP